MGGGGSPAVGVVTSRLQVQPGDVSRDATVGRGCWL